MKTIKINDKGDILIWISILLLLILSLLNLNENIYAASAGLIIAIGIIFYWFLKGRKII